MSGESAEAFEFEASSLAAFLVFVKYAAGFLLAAAFVMAFVGFLGSSVVDQPTLSPYVLGVLVIVLPFAGAWLISEASVTVRELRVDAEGVTIRRMGELARFFVPWSRVRKARLTRLRVALAFEDEAGRGQRAILPVPWRRAVDVVRLKGLLAEKLRPTSPPP